ncbi:transcriptional regulator [Periweissella cryptocerci]|uniref:Transcriptional regulator n=1 Tax=Periweissella cryptocerci TaxID=2506420 RepID=A0A4V1AIG4_9LACO|nr:transcriptional regulator [Periweissella cryptocerci]QBO35415.1 transcriptional regulator [Periweissella cryptocerci]
MAYKLVMKNRDLVLRQMPLHGYNSVDFAEKYLGINRAHWTNIQTGKIHPRPALAKKIASGLDLEIKDIFDLVQ